MPKDIGWLCPIPQRFVITIFGITAIMNAYTMRNCLSLTITQLVVPRKYNETNYLEESICPKQEEPEMSEEAQQLRGEYDWNQALQGQILGAFFIGYLISHLPGGVLSDLYGAKWVLNIGLIMSSVLTIFTPLIIRIGGPYALLGARFSIGLAQGVIFPACSNLNAHWAPPQERATLGAMVMSGGILGQILAVAISGLILTYYRWPFVFIFFGVFGIAWSIFFTFMGFSDPHEHPFITKEEVEFLEAEMGIVKASGFKGIPWLSIMTSIPMWALICCQVGHDWGLFLITTDLPKYMHDVLQFNVATNGLVSSLPFLCMWLCSVIMGFVSDWILRTGKISLTNVRKIMTMIAQAGPATFMVLASYAGCDKTLVVLSFSISLFLMGPYFSGMKLTAIDLSPNFSGTLMAITNGIGALSGYFAPLFVGLMTPNTELHEWRDVFWVAFGILVVTGIVFCIFGSGKVQKWNERKEKT